MSLTGLATPVGVVYEPTLSSMTDTDLHELRQCERIIQFRNAVFAGSHPRIRIPSHLVGKSTASLLDFPRYGNGGPNSQPFTSNKQLPAVQPVVVAPDSIGTRAFNFGFGSVDQSQDLARMQIRVQRQRLERTLAEQVEKRRAPARVLGPPEVLADLDISDVLARAQALVTATAPAATLSRGKDSVNIPAASESGDESSFYSSHHDSSFEVSVIPPEGQQSSACQNPSTRNVVALPACLGAVASSHEKTSGSTRLPGVLGSHGSSPSGVSVSVDGDTVRDVPVPTQHMPQPPPPSPPRVSARRQSPPPARNNDVSSRPPPGFVPYPPHQTAGDASSAEQQGVTMVSAAPVQVATLRNVQPARASSPDSSPQGGRQPEKKKGRKKAKRKADRQAPEAEPSAYIKSEPQSPSPLISVPSLRPHKRQRLSERRDGNDSSFSELRNPPSGVAYEEYYPQYRDDRIHIPMPRNDDLSIRRASSVIVGVEPRLHPRPHVDDRRFAGNSQAQPFRRPLSPTTYIQQPASGNTYVGAPSAQIAIETPFHEPRHLAHDLYEANRVGFRPPGGARSPLLIRERQSPIVGTPRSLSTRIVIDAYGREYVEHLAPNPVSIGRQSAMPIIRGGEPEIVYEGSAVGPIYRQSYGEASATYQQHTPPAFPAPRRVLVQSDAGVDNYRAYGHREYSARPLGVPVDEYSEYQRFSERRPLDGQPYVSRSVSVRPAEPPVQYEPRRDYERIPPPGPGHDPWIRDQGFAGHVQSHRASVHPGTREYSVHPGESRAAHREYSVRLVDPYPGEHIHMPAHDDGAHLERRDGSQTMTYGSRGTNRDGYV